MPPTDFTKERKEKYLQQLRDGNLKLESARRVGVSYRTIQRHREADEEFREGERIALAEAREGVEKVLRDMALQGDLGAIKLWLRAHDRSTYGDKQTVEIDATPAALELSRTDLQAEIVKLQQTLAERAELLAGDVIDVESREV